MSFPLTLSEILTLPSPLENLTSFVGIKYVLSKFLLFWMYLSTALPNSLQLSNAINPSS